MRLMLIFLAGFAIFRGLDIYQTAYMIQTSGMYEEHPFALWCFREYGLTGMITMSISMSIIVVITPMLAYLYKEKYKRAGHMAVSAAAFACVVSGLVMLHWGSYHNESIDVNNCTLQNTVYINTNKLPVPQIVVSGIKLQRKAQSITQFGSPKDFQYLPHLFNIGKVKVAYLG